MDFVALTLGQLVSFSLAMVAIGFGIGHCITHVIYVKQFERELRRIRIDQ